MSNGDLINFKPEKKTYTYKGRKNKTKYLDFVKLCKMTQPELKEYLINELVEYYDVFHGDGYIYAKGENVLLTAHMDTVHKEVVKDFYETKSGIISSPQGIGGDDRCGIYMILTILRTTEHRPSILFCEDEEIGGVGSNKFLQLSPHAKDLVDLNFMIELDRANANDIVFYNDDNKDFHEFVANITGYKKATGSFSDISHLCPFAKISGVNISCGYYHAHTLEEEVNVKEMMESIKATIKLLDAAQDCEQFEYQEKKIDLFDDYYHGSYNWIFGEFSYKNSSNKIEVDISDGQTKAECIGNFLTDHPEVCWNDVIDADFTYDEDYYGLMRY